jgi:hypothetical protein
MSSIRKELVPVDPDANEPDEHKDDDDTDDDEEDEDDEDEETVVFVGLCLLMSLKFKSNMLSLPYSVA